MQVSVEATEGLERRMKVTIPAEQIESEVNSRLKSLVRTVRIKGFRPGKVPMSVVVNRYGMHVRQEVLNEMTQTSFREAIAKNDIQLASMPRIEPQSSQTGEDFEYAAVFEVIERFDIAPIKDIKITKPVAEITEQNIDNMLENLRKQRADWQTADRAGEKNDQLVVDFHGTIEGKDFEGNEGSQVPIELGADKFIAGFEDQLLGAKAGDERTVKVTFPDDYHAKDLAGKEASFEVKISSVSEPVLPELDEEFIRGYDVPDGTIESLRKEIRGSMQDELEQAIRGNIKEQVMTALLTANPVELPQAKVDEQIELLMAQTRETLQSKGAQFGDVELDRVMFEVQAKKRVALGLLTAEIIKQQNMTPAPDIVRTKVESVSASYDSPDEVVNWYYADTERLASIEAMVLEDQVVDWVTENADVAEEQTTFDAMMKNLR